MKQTAITILISMLILPALASGLPTIQEAEIADNARLYGLMAAMLRNNPQLLNLYIGYEDGSF